jgi:P pilus assembly chaperone PapD
MVLNFSSLSSAALQLSGCVLSALFLLPGAAQAQLSVSPLVIETEAQRGQAQGAITIANTSNAPIRLRIYAEPFTYSRDKGFQRLESSPNDLTPYLQFSPRELTIQPGEQRRVRLLSRLAPSLPEGEYRAVIFTETLTERQDSSGNNVNIRVLIGSTVYVRQGDIAPNLAVEGASWNSEQNQIQLLVRNTGEASVRPKLNWTLKQGETVVETGNLDETAVIAESDRNFLLQYPGNNQSAPTPGQYQLTGELVWSEDDSQRSQSFSVDLRIPATAATGQ